MKSIRITSFIALTAVLISFILPAAFAPAKAETVAPVIEKPVHVTVVDEFGNPVDGVTVEVRDDGGEKVGEAVSVGGTLSVFLPAGDYTVQGTAVPDGYLLIDETHDVSVELQEAEERDNILGNTVTDHEHPAFCSRANHIGLEMYSVSDGEETVTAYCFNQNYDNPYDYAGYRRLVGTPELLFQIAQNKNDDITPQELYDHVLSIIYHRDEMQAKYGFDEVVTRYLTNMCIKSFTDPKKFFTFDDEGNSTLIRDENGRPILDENGNYQYNGNGTVLGSILNHSRGDNGSIQVPQEFINAYHELIQMTDHPSDYYLYIYYPGNFQEGNTDTYQCLMSTFEVSPVRVQLVVRQATYISITKIWDDSYDQDGKRPTADEFARMVTLTANGEDVTDEYADKLSVIDNGDDTYTVTYAGLPRTDEGQEDIEYVIHETEIPGYTADRTGAGNGESITNTHEPILTDITVSKIWEDENDKDGLRPESITVHLFADGKEIDSAAIEADENGDWSHTFTGLPVYRDGKEIEYTVTEDVVEGYEAEIEEFVICNRYIPNTGDGSRTAGWASLMALSVLGVAYLRRRREDED